MILKSKKNSVGLGQNLVVKKGDSLEPPNAMPPWIAIPIGSGFFCKPSFLQKKESSGNYRFMNPLYSSGMMVTISFYYPLAS